MPRAFRPSISLAIRVLLRASASLAVSASTMAPTETLARSGSALALPVAETLMKRSHGLSPSAAIAVRGAQREIAANAAAMTIGVRAPMVASRCRPRLGHVTAIICPNHAQRKRFVTPKRDAIEAHPLAGGARSSMVRAG